MTGIYIYSQVDTGYHLDWHAYETYNETCLLVLPQPQIFPLLRFFIMCGPRKKCALGWRLGEGWVWRQWEGIKGPRKFQRAVDLVFRCTFVIQKFNKCKEGAVVIL